MEIEMASAMGFCFGVKRAIDLVERAAQERGPLQTLGALVHNRQVVERLAECGVDVAENLDEVKGNIVAIASHGVGPDVMERVEQRGLEVVDATCPFVRKAQTVAQELAREGFRVLVFGDAAHPEVRGVLGYAGENADASLEAPSVGTLPKRLGVLCQTTQNQERFAEFLAELVARNVPGFSELRVHNTICDATSKHQAAALELAERVDLMVVVGGQDSANTRRLARICSDTGVATYHIESAADIDSQWLSGPSRVGVTAGASTPDEVIEEVVAALQEREQQK
jgi:4-hydroxy-3-methylbut-2-enyl diphosphate reductase